LEGIGVLEEEAGLCGNPSASGNDGVDVSVGGAGNFSFEAGAENSLLDPDLSWNEFSVGVEACHFCAGPGAAGGAIEGRAGAQDEVSRRTAGGWGSGKEFDVIDEGACFAGDPGGEESGTNGGRGGYQLGAVGEGERERVVLDEKEPVAAPGDVSFELPVTGDVYGNGGSKTIAWDVRDGDPAIFVEMGRNSAYWGFDLMLSRADSAHVSESRDEADGSVAAHSEVSDIVEEDDSGGGCGIDWFAEECADDDFGSAGFTDDSAAEMIEFGMKTAHSIGKISSAEIGATCNDDSRWFPFRVGVDDLDTAIGCHVFYRNASGVLPRCWNCCVIALRWD